LADSRGVSGSFFMLKGGCDEKLGCGGVDVGRGDVVLW